APGGTARLTQPAGGQAVGAVARRAVAVADGGGLLRQIEDSGRLHQPAGAGEALLVPGGAARGPAAEELLAQRVAQLAAGAIPGGADAGRRRPGPGQPAVAGELHQVVARAEEAGALEGAVVPGRGQVDVAGQARPGVAQQVGDDRPETGPRHLEPAVRAVAGQRPAEVGDVVA